MKLKTTAWTKNRPREGRARKVGPRRTQPHNEAGRERDERHGQRPHDLTAKLGVEEPQKPAPVNHPSAAGAGLPPPFPHPARNPPDRHNRRRGQNSVACFRDLQP